MDDNVIYVTPDGQAFTGKQFNNLLDKFSNVWEAIKKAFTEIASKLINVVKKYFGIAESIKTENKSKMRHSWNTPWNTTRRSQVMNRQPLFTNIRSQL